VLVASQASAAARPRRLCPMRKESMYPGNPAKARPGQAARLPRHAQARRVLPPALPRFFPGIPTSRSRTLHVFVLFDEIRSQKEGSRLGRRMQVRVGRCGLACRPLRLRLWARPVAPPAAAAGRRPRGAGGQRRRRGVVTGLGCRLLHSSPGAWTSVALAVATVPWRI
jgi:hypothetical protein